MTNFMEAILMSKHYTSIKAVCPYYKDETNKRITVRCQGYNPECTYHVTFSNPYDLKKHLKKYCYTFGYKKCPLYYSERD